MTKGLLRLTAGLAAVAFITPAMAGDGAGADQVTIEAVSQMLHYSGGNDRMRVEIAPNYSEELGWSMKGAAGTYLTDAIALGLIVEYGENKREYLANAGIQFNDALSFVATAGMLEEHNQYFDGEGRKTVQQMEYGGSLKGAYEVGILSGFELNGYLTNADSGSKSVETGKLYGVQLMTDVDLTSSTHFKVGGGYEWLAWDGGSNNDSFTFSAEGTQQLGDMLSLNGNVKLGASEYVYGGGVALDLSNGGENTNKVGLNYSYIDGRNGIQDDQRVRLSWTMGFGAGPTQVASADTRISSPIQPVADVGTAYPANNLLGDVMERPSYLPVTTLSRAKAGAGVLDTGVECTGTSISSLAYGNYGNDVRIYPVMSNAEAINLFSWTLTEVNGTTLSVAVPYAGLDPGPYHTGEPYLLLVNGGNYDFNSDWTMRALYTGPDIGGLTKGCHLQLQTND